MEGARWNLENIAPPLQADNMEGLSPGKIHIPASDCVRSLPIRLERRIGAAMVANMLHSPAVLTFLDLLRRVARTVQVT
jgi:hypothetical protein